MEIDLPFHLLPIVEPGDVTELNGLNELKDERRR